MADQPQLPSQGDILARIQRIRKDGEDIFGYRLEVLLEHLDCDHLRDIAGPNADLSDLSFAPSPLPPLEAAGYLEYAFEKALDHREISASRSVQKLEEYAWLAGRQDVVTAMENAPYAQYGVPKLLVYAEAFGLPVPADEALARMGRGEPCEAGCRAGCDR